MIKTLNLIKMEIEIEKRGEMLEKAKLQAEYCKENKLNLMAPKDGICFRCSNQIYEIYTTEEATESQINGCPFCMQNFDD